MEYIEFERSGPIATIRLNRPERMNALGTQILEELKDAHDEVNSNDEIKAAIITGNGRAFCAGRDMKERSTADTDLSEAATTKYSYLFMENYSKKPLIAAVNGYAGGAGFYMATRGADLVVAAESARFQIAEVPRGILHGFQTGYWLGLGRAASLELAFGFSLSGARAYACGMANDLTSDGELMEVAMRRAEYVAQMPEKLIAANRALRARVENVVPKEVDAEGSKLMREMLADGTAAEGDRSFLEKRAVKPNE